MVRARRQPGYAMTREAASPQGAMESSRAQFADPAGQPPRFVAASRARSEADACVVRALFEHGAAHGALRARVLWKRRLPFACLKRDEEDGRDHKDESCPIGPGKGGPQPQSAYCRGTHGLRRS